MKDPKDCRLYRRDPILKIREPDTREPVRVLPCTDPLRPDLLRMPRSKRLH